MFLGSGVALITPFKNGEIDYDKIEELINYHIKNNTDALIICGTTGESSTMSFDEKINFIDFCVKKADKKIPVIAGTGSNNTKSSIKLSIEAQKLGVDGLLLITPYYNKSNDKGLYNHFYKISKAVDIPIILYNVPGRTGVNLKPQTVYELSLLENIIGIKEASGNISYATEIRRLCGKDFKIYSGNDDIIIPILSIGGSGVISVVANIKPKETHDLVMNFLNKNIEEALNLQLELKPLIDSLFIEVNPIPVKTAMNLMKFDVGDLREPLYHMDEENLDILKKELKNTNLI
ncbi:MAG: 4-hydroxy-tetrahydrodipicolinate synthase [Peptostreptococcaceae bacterium]|jgi:4-hydroxy-tetrahydrodipicolinate synthase|nr:4-hydroxy-tetrahydrodipicolinate synthase [Peptostreptococcaceae bacterium]